MSFKFIKVKDPSNKFSISDITFDIADSDATLTELIGEFERFLQACGYAVESESLGITEGSTDVR